MDKLVRRGFLLGDVPENIGKINDLASWKEGYPILLKGKCLEELSLFNKDIKQSENLVRAILNEEDCDAILAKAPYLSRLEKKFQSLGSIFNQGNDQEIEMVMFDALDGDKIIAEDLWMKASWLSFHEDPSMRFRFSFGMDQEEDVAADPHRQKLSAQLTDVIFPESAIITENKNLKEDLTKILGSDKINFVERIIYYNAPNGGAYMHHDLERGHDGVVFAQVTGCSFWLALPKEFWWRKLLIL